MLFACPLCHASLELHHHALRCPQAHQFDIAKEGYVNLLPVQHKRSREPGDSAEMMQARRAFLDSGYYAPLRDCIAQVLENHLPVSGGTVLDIGCGEGYYTSAFADIASGRAGRAFGLDVSKAAIRAAAKRYRHAQFCVASSQRLPFMDATCDAVIRIYAPCNASELARVLKPGGVVITAAPGPRHLYQLKAEIYSEVRLHDEKPEILAGFSAINTVRLAYAMSLLGSDAVTLLQMTPFACRARPDVWTALSGRDHFSCDTDFCIKLWQRD